jgi:hypothetical protein
MKINKLIALLIVFVLVFATVGTAFAEEGDVGNPTCDPADPECTVDPENGDDWVHPIVALLGAYMEYQQSTAEPDTTCDPATDPTCTTEPTCDPATDPTCTTEPQCDPATDPTCIIEPGTEPVSFEDEIAALHADGVGFGVLVKLLSLSDKGDTPLAQLVDEFKNGQGFKQLYEDYGDATKKGVGHVKQELKCVENGGENCDSVHGNGKGKNKEGKPGKGNNKP